MILVMQLIDMTGASVTNKGAFLMTTDSCRFVVLMEILIGIYYEPNKEPPYDGPPKLHLLIESNEEWRVSVSVLLRALRAN